MWRLGTPDSRYCLRVPTDTTTRELDLSMMRIQAAIELAQTGEHEAARRTFARLWDEIGADGDAFHRCTIAHYMADVQTDPHDELAWDLRALDAAGSIENARVHEHALDVSTFWPSLHLNVANSYQRVGMLEKAREHVVNARDAMGSLATEGLGAMTRSGIERLAQELGI